MIVSVLKSVFRMNRFALSIPSMAVNERSAMSDGDTMRPLPVPDIPSASSSPLVPLELLRMIISLVVFRTMTTGGSVRRRDGVGVVSPEEGELLHPAKPVKSAAAPAKTCLRVEEFIRFVTFSALLMLINAVLNVPSMQTLYGLLHVSHYIVFARWQSD